MEMILFQILYVFKIIFTYIWSHSDSEVNIAIGEVF